MIDIVSEEVRSRLMSGIKGRNTKPEILVRRALHAAGYRFRLHKRELPGSPDIVMPGRKIAIFVHGCFWHMHEHCRLSKIPSTRTEFWARKLTANVARDSAARKSLNTLGWRVLIVWECYVRGHTDTQSMATDLSAWIEDERQVQGELSAGRS